jgi:hypothetical protein
MEGTVRVATGLGATMATMAVMSAAITGMVGAAIEADGTADTGVSASALAGIVPGIIGAVTIRDTTITSIIPTPTLLTSMLHTATTEAV